MLDERKENRRLRLIQLMAERFAGKQALLSDHVGVSPNLVSRYVRGVKGIGEDMRDKERTKPPKRAVFFGYSEEVVEQRKRASSCSRPVTALRVIQGLQCWQSVSWITRATSSCHLRRTCSSARQPFNWGRKCRPAFTVATVEHEVLLVADDLARRRLPAPPTLKPCVTRTGFRHLRARHRLTALLRAVKSLPRSPAATGAPEARYCAQGFDVGPPALTRREV